MKSELKQEGSITITEGRDDRYRSFWSGSNWFNNSEYYTFKEQDDCLIIIKHYMEIPPKAQQTKIKNGGRFWGLSELPLGKFKFDEEESTEDQLVIYCS